MRKITEKNSVSMKLTKAVTALLSAIYCLFMPAMTGAGLLYNGRSYGAELSRVGALFIVAAALMSAAAVLCFFRKKTANVLAVIFSFSGASLCLAMLRKLCIHADRSGWSDKFTMEQISHMYQRRLLPCILPAVLIIAVSVIQLRRKNGGDEEYTSIL